MPYLEQGDANGVPLILVHAVGDSAQDAHFLSTSLATSLALPSVPFLCAMRVS
jgi:hypothetical protein